jgi:YD repeat-containing protein
MKKVFAIIGLIFISFSIKGQDLPNIVPPSPEASALLRFTNIPVSHYTGLANISVPIYTIQENGINIPISLSYHGRGVQLSEIAPRTGQGWSLQYGGSLSRQIRGKGDESPNYGYLSQKDNFLNYSSSQQARNNVNTIEKTHPDYDFYPDQFSFNAGGASGKFILSYINEQEPVIQSFDDVKITYNIDTFRAGYSAGIASFQIIDAKGNKYYYGVSKKDLERKAQDFQTSTGFSVFGSGDVVNDQSEPSSEVFPSSWKLMDIETVNGGLISYFYENTSNYTYYRKLYDKHIQEESVTNSTANMSDYNKIMTRVSNVDNYAKDLKKIEFNNGRDSIVFFKSQTVRQDAVGNALERISIFGKGKLIKSYKLNYEYTHSNDTSNMLSYFAQSATFSKSFYRMYLSSLEEEAEGGEKLPPYSFTYNNLQALPSMFSSKQDYWGYYNGATNNGPFTRLFNYGNYAPNRRVDTIKSERGILKEIKYPTGGKTKFTYEHNRGSFPINHRNILIPEVNPPSAQNEVTIRLAKEDFNYDSTNGYTPLVIQMPTNTKVNYRFTCFHLTDANDPNNANTPDCIFEFTLNGNRVNINENLEIYTSGNGTMTIGVLTPSFPGVDSDLHRNPDYNFFIKFSYIIPNAKSSLYAAGKRIKKIENIDENGNSTIKEYEYVYSLDPTKGGTPQESGTIIGLPAYLSGKEFVNGYTVYNNYNDATSAYSSFQPNSISYSSVIEYIGTKQNNIGKVEYSFTNISDSGGDYFEFPYHPPTDNEWLRGKNIKTRFHKKGNNNDYFLVKEIYNKYSYSNLVFDYDLKFPGLLDPSFPFTPEASSYGFHSDAHSAPDTSDSRTLIKLPMFMRERRPSDQRTNQDYVPGYRIYHFTGGTQDLKEQIVLEYNESGTIESATTYGYDYNNHYQLSEKEFTDSSGDILKTKYYYPTTDAILNNANRMLPPIKTETYKNASLQSRVNTIYNTFSDNYLYLPQKIQTSKGNNSLKDQVIYHDYDNKGNPIEVSKKDGTHIVYLWGYGKQYPVAKIENSTYSDIEGILGEGFDLDSGGLTMAQEDNLRDSNLLSKSFITTYTYDPLIGVTSITDPRGETIYYHYDDFNRLESVKDAQGYLLSKNKYNYKN